jgi:hypothetical protein
MRRHNGMPHLMIGDKPDPQENIPDGKFLLFFHETSSVGI